jgi:hypothetical protein
MKGSLIKDLDNGKMYEFFGEQLKTPDNERISFSRNWPKLEKPEPEEKEAPKPSGDTYWSSKPIDVIAEDIENEGGTLTWSQDFNSAKHDLSDSQWTSLIDKLASDSSNLLYKLAKKGKATRITGQPELKSLAS